MNHFVIDFGSYNMIAKINNEQLELKKYNSIIDYEHETFKFKAKIKITDKDINIGDKAKQSHNSLFIDNLCQEFKNPQSKYSILNKKYTINQITEAYFSVIKNELDNHSENEPVDALTLVIPYEYTKTNKENLKKVLNNIHFKFNHMIEEPIANYFGYLKMNHLEVPHKDSFMMLNIDYDSIIVKIFDVEKNQKIIFQLDSNAYDMTFDLYDLMRNYFLEKMSVNKKYHKLSKGDQEYLDEGIDSLFKSFKNKKIQSYDLYIGLQDEYSDFEKTYSRTDFNNVLNHIGFFKTIYSIIDKCLAESNKRQDEIMKIIYTGELSMIYDIQEKINSYYQIQQDIMEDEEKLTCIGGFLASSYNYTIVDHSLKIGMMKKEKKGLFKTIDIFNELISSYSTIISQSTKLKIPQAFDGQLEIYEGYNGAGKNDCTLLSRIDISQYCDGHHRLSIERKAKGGDISLVIYENGEEVDRLKVGDK